MRTWFIEERKFKFKFKFKFDDSFQWVKICHRGLKMKVKKKEKRPSAPQRMRILSRKEIFMASHLNKSTFILIH